MSAPQNLVQIQEARKAYGSRVLFESASLSVNTDEHIGVIGPNGAGKTTLFKILAKQTELDGGRMVCSRSLRLGYLEQHDRWNAGEKLEEFLSRGTRLPLWELKKLGQKLGLSEDQFRRPVENLSGGYRMRAKLLHLLGEEPNLMLLDEPTNYLDLESLLVLEEFLQNYHGAFLLISHDREFLRRTTDHILEIESGEFTKFNGNIDDYFEQKELLRSQLEKQAATQAAKRKEILDFVARFGAKATKARQAQSRLKQLRKMEQIVLKALPVAAKIRIPEPRHTGRLVAELKDAQLGYPDRLVLKDIDLKVEKGDRIGIVGFNGAGKSTLLRSLAKDLPVLGGQLEYGYQVSSAYFAQHVSERLDPGSNVYDELNRAADRSITSQEILDLAGGLLFSGDASRKSISVLSGGEKARVALGQILLQKAPLLLMDEPTNHLDFYTVEALTQALETYPGTLVIVSHDRGFIRRIATKIFEVKNGSLRVYPGTYDEYVWSVQNSPQVHFEENFVQKPPQLPQQIQEEPQKPALRSFHKAQIKALQAELRKLEKHLQEIDRKMKSIESRMNEQSQKISEISGVEAAKMATEMAAAQRKLQELESDFLNSMSMKDEIDAKIQSLKE